MATWVEADFLGEGTEAHSHCVGKYWDGLVPWVPFYPRTVDGPRFSDNVLAHMREEHEQYMEVIRLWSMLPSYYVTTETEQVRTAMNGAAVTVDGLLKAAEVLDGAVTVYDESVPEPMSFKLEHDRWARTTYDSLTNPLTGTDEEKEDKFNELMNEVEIRKGKVQNALEVLQSARQTLADTLNGVDVQELGAPRFTVMEGGLDSADSQQELELALMQSDLFGGELTWAQVERIAGEIDLDALPYDYVDSEGRKWITNAEGVRVRVGSAMDPNLNAQIIVAIGSDPETSHIQIPTGYDGEGNVVVQSASDIVTFANGEAADRIGPVASRSLTVFEILMLAPTMFVAGDMARTNAQVNGVLMSTEDLQQVYNHHSDQAFFSTTLSSLASWGTTSATALVVLPVTGPSGLVVVYAVDQATGEVVSAVVEGIYDDTWTQAELERKGARIQKADEFDEDEYERLKGLAEERAAHAQGDG